MAGNNNYPQTWRQAFNQLKQGLNKIKTPRKKVLFFDEILWLDTHKSGFLSAFEYFWNTYCFDRNDHTINICEIKFSNTTYKITKKYNEELQNKLMMFRQSTGTRKTLMLTFITTYGMYDNEYRVQLEDNDVKMDDLFN